MYGFIHSTESFGAADGPGIRFVIFMQGCNMRCKFCHNPDSWSFSGEKISAEALLERAVRYRDFWGETGGITVSGGEPMLQAEFISEFLSLTKAHGIHTALDTSAQPFDKNDTKYTDMLKKCSLVLLDIKHIDSEKHKDLTGFDNENILDCAKFLEEQKIPVWIRHVLIPGYESDAELIRLGEFIKSLSNVQRTELLPYHTLGRHKWEALGYNYPLEDVPPTSKDDIDRAMNIMF